ncbi:hypothetical protein L1049_007659 [Liquidambar formosana]|uniref:Tudor domain-containing protein n=1 Tax=Liquidambar formosana TaxID=63359 RepID=A0AAP0S9B1_LIQFO
MGVYELSGEPAIVINGVPNVPPSDGTLVLCETASGAESHRNTGFGAWLEGREVRKLFGEQFYSGTVTKFDKESGWYRVVYEDGDFEDLDWDELKQVLLPLDITIPLKTLALKIIKKSQKPIYKSGKYVARSGNRRAKNVGSKGKTIEAVEGHSLMKFDGVE